MNNDSDQNNDFEDDTPTQPRVHETLAEVSARWEVAKLEGVDPEPAIPERIRRERVTRNIRRPSTDGDRLIKQVYADLRAEQVDRDWECECSSCVNRNKPNNQE